MSLMAIALPIAPGKRAAWHAWVDELNGPRQEEFAASRHRAGVRERTFLQETPDGDLVIVTLEGDDPARAFKDMMAASDPFTRWFVDRAADLHGMDPEAMATASAPTLLVDSDAVPVAAR